MSLLEVAGLEKSYTVRRNVLGRPIERTVAVDGVSFSVNAGETLAVVGESGAGKSTVGRLVLRLIEADAGSVRFDDVDVLALKPAALRAFRRNAQMIFQNPYSSLDPHVPVGESVAEPLLIHFGTGKRERTRRAEELLDHVGLTRAVLQRHPAELSGGQLQRVAIARALTLEPRLIVCDEPVAALDVSVRAQVLNLMRELQVEHELAYLFISHDLALVEAIADRVAVMRRGQIVEIGTTTRIFSSPDHDYTRELLESIPIPVPRSMRRHPKE